MGKGTRELHRQIAMYRDLLGRGPPIDEAMRYLRRIMELEAELERIKLTDAQAAAQKSA